MASAMASTASRNIPHPYTVPVGPRIRPPRLLPGTKAANTDPKPKEPPPIKGHVWVQGQWRNPGSVAARDQREVQSAKVEKALRHATHGMNIYAYSHVRTNQVVYSLTRVMQNNKMLAQLVNHGKQTVPSSLRRDVWRPYFSMHFSETPAGAEAGLKAYRRLRELSILRQLSPSPELITATQADVEKVTNKYLPSERKRRLEEQTIKDLPVEGKMLPKKHRARKLMDQKASSVADAAWVLAFMNKNLSPAEELDAVIENQSKKHEQWSARAMRRLNKIRSREAAKEAQIKAKQEAIQPDKGDLGLTPHTARRISLEHSGVFTVPSKGMEFGVNDLAAIKHQKEITGEYIAGNTASQALPAGERRPADFNPDMFRSGYIKAWKEQHGDTADGPLTEDVELAVKKEQDLVQTRIADFDRQLAETKSSDTQKTRNGTSRTVQVLWADIRDATWAEQWPSNVFHGELEARAAIKRATAQVQRTATTIDQQGNEIDYQAKRIVVQSSSTPHVFGNNTQDRWYEKPEQMTEKRQVWRASKLTKWQDSKLAASREILSSFDALHRQLQDLQIKKAELQPEFDALQQLDAKSSQAARDSEPSQVGSMIQNLTQDEVHELRSSMNTTENRITAKNREIQKMQENYPSLYQKVLEVLEWRNGQRTHTKLLKIRDEIEGLDFRPLYESQDPDTLQKLQQIDIELSSYSEAHPILANNQGLQTSSIAQVATIRERISTLEQQIVSLENAERSPQTETRLQDVEDTLDNERRLLQTELDGAFVARQDAVRNTLESLESNFNNEVIDLLANRAHLEQQNNTSAIEEIDQQLQEHADRKLMESIGLQPTETNTDVQEYNENMREKGIEAPAPKKQGIFGRIKGLFGR